MGETPVNQICHKTISLANIRYSVVSYFNQEATDYMEGHWVCFSFSIGISQYVFSVLLDVESTQNLALGKYAEQSSEVNPAHPATKVVDGGTGGHNCTMTQSETDPFWIVDLEHVYRISHVTISTSQWWTGKLGLSGTSPEHDNDNKCSDE